MSTSNTDQTTADLEQGASNTAAVIDDVDQSAADDAAAGGDAPAGDEGAAAEGDFDFDAWQENASIADVRFFMEHGRIPGEGEGTDTPAAGDAGDDAAAGDDTGAAAAPAFKFTENAPDDVFDTEAAAYLEQVEITPELQTIIDHQRARIETLSQAAAADPTVESHMTAFNELVEFVEDPDTRQWVPKTQGVVQLLKETYPNEMPFLVQALVSQPSQKYAGVPLFKEWFIDHYELPPDAVATLDYVLENKGKLPIPSFVPEGLDKKLAEAFWTSTERDAIQAKIDRAVFTLNSDRQATDADKPEAQTILRNENQKLAQIQAGIDATNEKVKFLATQTQNAQATIKNTAVENYNTTAIGLRKSFGDTLAKSFDGVLDEAGAKINGLAIATMIENAFNIENPTWAAFAQKDLESHGIKFDWNKGMTALTELYSIEEKIANLEAMGKKVNPRAIELAREDKAKALKEIRGLETKLAGAVVAKVVTGHSKTLTKKVQAAPGKKIAAVRTKTQGTGVQTAARKTPDDMPLDELRKVVFGRT